MKISRLFILIKAFFYNSIKLIFRKYNFDLKKIWPHQKILIQKFLDKIFIIDSGY